MTDTTPTAHLGLDLRHADRTRDTGSVEVRWSADGTRILVARTVDPRPWPLLDAARPDLGAALALGGAAVWVLGTIRVLRRPRAVGRAYCRRCNHDLNAGPGVRPSSPRCPECGRALDSRAIAMGSAPAGRLARVAIPSIVAIALGVSVFVESIGHMPAPFGTGGPAWPIAAASSIGKWPWWRRTTIEHPAGFARRVDIVRVEQDALCLEASALIRGVSNWIPRPDGAVIAWSEHSVETGWVPRIAWSNASNGRKGSADLGAPHVGFPSVCGWSADGQEVIALVQRTGTGFPTREDGTAIVPIDVFAIDMASGMVRPLDSGEGRATGNASTAWVLGPAIAAIGPDPETRTVILVGEQADGIALRHLCIIGTRGMRVVPVAAGVVPDAWGFRRAWITPDGRLGIELDSGFRTDGELQRHIDLTTGAVSDPSTASGRISPDGTRIARIEVDWSTQTRISRMRVVVERSNAETAGTAAGDALPLAP